MDDSDGRQTEELLLLDEADHHVGASLVEKGQTVLGLQHGEVENVEAVEDQFLLMVVDVLGVLLARRRQKEQ